MSRFGNLQIAFDVAGDHAFRIWGYGTTDSLEEVISPGYFVGAPQTLGPGDLVVIRTVPRFDPVRERTQGEHRLAWAMVRRNGGGVVLRLVDDLGRPTDPDAGLRRPPGRPRKATRMPDRPTRTREPDRAAPPAA
jgi:hypothetical protein